MAFDLQAALKKMNDVDKDFRITATTDLTEELRKDSFVMDAASESKVVDNILRLLSDSAKEVQDVAVKCLGPLVRRVGEQHITNIVNKLSENLALAKRGSEELREISTSGLKTVLRDVDDKLGERIGNLLIPGLLAAIKTNNPDIVQECLDVTNDLLSRFGAAASAKQQQEILDVVLPQLDSTRNLIKQRTIWVLTNVARYCSEDAFGALCAALVKKLGGDLKKQNTSIQLVGSIARNVGFRMGKHVNDFVPLLKTAVVKSSKDGDEDIKENSFQTFCSFVESCPRDTRAHIDTILALCLQFLSWDPNQLEDSGEGSGGEAGSDGEDGDDGDDSGMEASEDEDDKTFMVRRAAAKNIASIVRNHGERLDAVVDKAAAPLVRQFKERESTARQEVLGAYETLALAVAPLGKTHAIYTAFVKSLPDAIKELAKLLQHKSADTKAAAASTLRSLGSHYTGVLGPVIPELIPGVSAGVLDSNSALRIGSLELLKQILNGSTETAPVQPHLDKLFAPVDKLLHTAGLHSRAAAAGLDACEAFLVAGAGKIDFLNRVFKTFETLYKQTDLDSEAKEAAIRAGARAICNLGTKLPNVSAALDVLIERLGSELTRETAAVAVGTIAESGTDVGSNAWLDKAVPLLLSFCAPGARTLKVAALSSLALVLENHGDTIKTHTQIVDEVAQLVDAEDMQLTQLAISVTTHAIHTSPKAVPNAKKSTYPRVQAILTSPLLEGISLTAVAEFYGELSRLDTKGFSFAELSKDLETAVKATTEVQVFRNVGACYAHVIVGTPDVKKAAATVQTLVKNVGAKTDAERLAAIYTLGEIGRAKDISEYGGVVEALAAALDAESRNVALGASLAIGRCATGNLSTYLPFILNDMKKNPKRQLLLLQAVKEIVSGNSSGASAGAGLRVSLSASIAGSAVQDIAVHLDTLLPILVQHAASEDELTRNAVAECLGRLARLAPERIINEVVSRSKDASPWARATATNALRSAVSEKPSADLDSLLLKAYSVAAEAIADKDVHVRYAGLLAVTWALQVKPRIVRPHIAAALPAIYKETVVDESLIKVIDLGQIKHITDNGLDKRTAAYALLNVLLDTAFDAISVGDYLDPIVRAMEDVPNVKEDAFHLLRRLAQVAGSQLFRFLDKLVPLLEKELKRPIPKAEPGQERLLAMKRAGVQAALSLAALPNATSNAKLQELLVKHVVNGIYKDLYVEIASKSGAPAVAIAAANAAVAAAPKDAKK